MTLGTWLVPGPVCAGSLEGLRTWLLSLAGLVEIVALDVVEVAGERTDPFALAAGLSGPSGMPRIGVAVELDGERLPPLIGRELVALDHLTAGATGLILAGRPPGLEEAARILRAQLAGTEVAGSASAAMPADFAFTTHPCAATPGGPPVIVLDLDAGARTLAGQDVVVLEADDDELRAGAVGAGGADGITLVRRGGRAAASGTMLAL